MRRRGLTVALIGPDGAGKTTVARALPGRLRAPAKYIYMGVNWDASEHLLPTTRLVQTIRKRRDGGTDTGGPPPPPGEEESASPPQSLARKTWSILALANRVAEEWYRHLLVWLYVRRGVIVVFDRDFFSDYHAHDVAGGDTRPFTRRIHGYLLQHVYPKPDLVVFLDAPAAVLHARKGEGTIEALERRRQDYLALAEIMPRFVAVDATNSLDDVVGDVVGEIARAAGRTSRSPGSS